MSVPCRKRQEDDLVDADLRKSVLRGRYKANREKYGLSHYLSGQMELDDVCCRTNVNNFDIIFAGPIPPNPSELLGGDAFKNMLEVLRMKYDYVIVDTPPLGSVIDGAVVGAICDGTVLVVESGAISYKFAQNVKRTAGQGRLSDSWMRPEQGQHQKNPYYGKYYGYYYGSYYGYGNDGTDEAQDELMLDTGSQTDATASETETTVPEQGTEEKGMQMSTKGLTIGFFIADAALIAVCAFFYLQMDRTAPVITLPDTEQIYTTGTDTDKLLEGVTAYDSHDGDVTDSLLIEKVTETGNGEVIVTYAAVDSSNNVAELSRILKTEK